MAKTAAKLMAELAQNKQHQEIKAEIEKEANELKKLCEQDEKELVCEINEMGFIITSVWDFVNSKNDYYEAVPILVKHLKIKHHPKIIAGLARSLAIPKLANNNELWETLVNLYDTIHSDSNISEPTERGAQEAVAVALETLANESRKSDLIMLANKFPNGDGIQWLVKKLQNL